MFKAKAIFAILLICCMLLPACEQETQKTDSLISEDLMIPETPSYTTYTVEKKTISNFVADYAHVSFQETDLSWGNADAVYKQIWVTQGQQVSKGDWLITFTTEKSQVEVDALKLELDQLKMDTAAEKENKLLAIEDAKEAAKTLTGYELKIAQLKIQKQQIAYDKYVYETNLEIGELEEELKQLQITTDNYGIQAPFSGVIDYIVTAQLGTKVLDTSKALVTISNREDFFISMPYDTKLRYNMETSLTNGSSTYTGTIITCPSILPASVSVSAKNVLVKLNENVSLQNVRRISSMTYYERLQDVPVVENTFVYTDDNGKYVKILEDNGEIHKRYVTLGPSNRNSYWVLDGLSEGQILIKN